MVIEQGRREIASSFEVNKNVALRHIRLSEASLQSSSLLRELSQSLKTELSVKPSSFQIHANSLILVVEFSFRIYDEADEHDVDLVRLDCKMEADYALRSGYKPIEEQVKAFHEGNAIFNCWPYFREFVQNSTVRMGYPPPPVPLLRLAPKRETQSSDQPLLKRTTKKRQVAKKEAKL